MAIRCGQHARAATAPRFATLATTHPIPYDLKTAANAIDTQLRPADPTYGVAPRQRQEARTADQYGGPSKNQGRSTRLSGKKYTIPVFPDSGIALVAA